MPINQSNRTERLIAEPLNIRLGIDQIVMPAVTAAKNIAAHDPRTSLLPPETKRIVDALHAICAAPPGTIVMWCGRPILSFVSIMPIPTRGRSLSVGLERSARRRSPWPPSINPRSTSTPSSP